MSKVLAYIPLHYGAEYLDAAIRAVSPCVDQILILYTSRPSYGHSSGEDCPETQEQLRDIAYNASDKIYWMDVTGMAGHEAQHRSISETFAQGKGFDQILAVDSDEVWDTVALKRALIEAAKLPNRRVKISGWVHFWRSFNWANQDGFLPVRICNLNNENTKEEGCVEGKIYHFGYAQSPEIIAYKLGCHGHKNELRPNWLNEKFLKWQPGIEDVHPTSIGLWNPFQFDKTTLPEVLKDHVNYNKELI